MLLHRGVQFLGKIIGYIRHPRLLLIGSTQAALIFIGLLVVLLLSIFAITLCTLQESDNEGSSKKKVTHWLHVVETRSIPQEFQRQPCSLPSSAPLLPAPIP